METLRRICPICGTGTCKFRNGIMCGAWICASGMMDGGNGGKDKGGEVSGDEFIRNFMSMWTRPTQKGN